MATLEESLATFGPLSRDPKVWARGVGLMQQFVEIRDRGEFQLALNPDLEQASAALKILRPAEPCKVHVIRAHTLFRYTHTDFCDLTTVLCDSPLQGDIPRGHLFTSISPILRDTLLRWQCKPGIRNNFSSAIEKLCRIPSRNAPLSDPRWVNELTFNYGGLWAHLLWHAFTGQKQKVEMIAPLSTLMSTTPVLGPHRKTAEWFILSA